MPENRFHLGEAKSQVRLILGRDIILEVICRRVSPVGRKPHRATAMVYAPCLELIGLAPLEANACRLPVVAVAEGSVRETIVDGVYGLRAG